MTDEQVVWSLEDAPSGRVPHWLYRGRDGGWHVTGPTSRPRYIRGRVDDVQVRRLARAGKIVPVDATRTAYELS